MSDQKNSKRILFLGYGESETKLISETAKLGFDVSHTRERVIDLTGFNLVVSFGYKHILPSTALDSALNPVINLHISYLPFNRGMHPNFWSHYDNTPAGVTIHKLDAGIDTGDILLQKKIFFAETENTFRKTWMRLIDEIEQLFLANFDAIYNQKFLGIPQNGEGSFHKASDLPVNFQGWDCVIKDEIERIKKI